MFNFRSLLSFVILVHGARALSQPSRPKISNPSMNQRRNFFKLFVPSILSIGYVATKPGEASANAVSSGVPLVGRFEELKGANSFIGVWSYTATKGIKEGELVFLKNGDVELRSADDSSTVIGVGAVPWKYVSPKGADTMVTITFTLDEDDQDNVLIFQGTMDAAGGPDRTMEGEISTGRAEIGARGNGPLKKAGSFKAQFKTTEISCPK